MRLSLARTWTVLNWLVIGIAVMLLVAALAVYTVPRLLGWQGVIVLTGSMEPALKTGGLVFVEPVEAKDVRPGDIISFTDSRGKTVTHRAIAIVETMQGRVFTTQGDSNEQPDFETVPATALKGKVRYHVPHVGGWSEWLREGNNFYYLLWPPAALIILGELWNVFSQLRRRPQGLNTGQERA
jgi:signal peptidase